ncbi:hypothetical protein FOQG_17283 [Fusarium oxysporum f. sp. raphani 54005]|uniref:Uncharacterized protein n=1 Tax=Fusarium oxysporum f. sp. raphani 54005 TaxID=1089458 RepID=X0B7A5_FUSOX|nr:hypothetical protein FOQG_17283 [Fusarium oxysporum f. sp. raphani 54005]
MTWMLGQRPLRLVLARPAWESLLSFIEVPEDLTADEIRTAFTLAESRIDYHNH